MHGQYARDLLAGDIALALARENMWSQSDNPVQQLIDERNEAIADRDELLKRLESRL